MMSRRSSWLIVGILLIPFAMAIGVPDLRVSRFHPETLREELIDVFAARCGVMGLPGLLLVPFSPIRDFSKPGRSR